MKDQDFDANARKLLFRRLLEGSPNGVNYAPDAQAHGEPGPLTIQIAQILRRHSRLWAQDMRDHQQLAGEILDGKKAWLEHMRAADAEVKRLIAGHTLGHGAAA